MVTDYLDGHMPLVESISVSLHLTSCRDCRAYLGQMKSMLKLLRQIPADPGPTGVEDQLLLRFRGRHRAAQGARRSRVGALRLLTLD